MRNLQGQLADYNLMLDRNRIHKNVDDILDECRQLEGANASERHRVDELLTHRAARSKRRPWQQCPSSAAAPPQGAPAWRRLWAAQYWQRPSCSLLGC